MSPAVVHLTYTLSDHTTAMTLCGYRITTDHRGTAQAKTGLWVSCPLCEAALALADVRPDMDAPRRSPTWVQPTLF